MADQTFIGVIEKHEPETFVLVTVDLQSGQMLRKMQFATKGELRKTFASSPEIDVEPLLAQGRNNPVK